MPRARAVLLFLIASLAAAAPSAPRQLTFADRVEAQRAIDRVYYSHQIGASKAFEIAVPPQVSERKVVTSLRETAALERFWHSPVTAQALRAEWKRIAEHSRFPERLEEIFQALGRDPVLFQETFVRSILVDRLSRSFFRFDDRVHGSARREVEHLHEQLSTGALSIDAPHEQRTVLDWVLEQSPSKSESKPSEKGEAGTIRLAPAEFERLRHSLPHEIGQIGPVTDEGESFTFRVVLEEEPGRVRIADYSVPKISWQHWWQGAEEELPLTDRVVAEPAGIGAREGDAARVAPELSVATCVPADTWDNGILDDIPRPASHHSGVWTGNLMIVWGGTGPEAPADGARYDPLTDTWTPISRAGAPALRRDHSAVWTGQRMIIWGGRSYVAGNNGLSTGGRYDPVADSWEPTATLGAPTARTLHTAIWTGSSMIVWGGSGSGPLATGGKYNPSTDQWSALSTSGAPAARYSHTAIWTGDRMVVWGGSGFGGGLNTGGRYNPQTDSWSATSLTNAPQGRMEATSVWTGSHMIVWGGVDGSTMNTGGRYDPAGDTWQATSTSGAPSERFNHSAVWTGSRMIVWGGAIGQSFTDSGGSYDPATNTWSPTSLLNAPSPREAHTAVWTDTRMIVWGGTVDINLETGFNTGGRYDPATDSWTPTSSTQEPAGRMNHSAIWTGNEMIIWGGGRRPWFTGDALAESDTGARYDALADTWIPTSVSGAPTRRFRHSAVWTGNEMIIWGGQGEGFYYSNGGRYDPLADSWSPTSLFGAPGPREGASAIWTGSDMIVWGGNTGFGVLDTGGRYRPTTDLWSPIPIGPTARNNHTAVWTGSRMIIWGGSGNTGAQYNPSTNLWTPLTTLDAPIAWVQHSAVWTGNRMMIWGGTSSGSGDTNTGRLYDPLADAWTPTSTLGAPYARSGHSAIWTGSRVLIWGGGSDSSGGSYDPVGDIWSPLSMLDAPSSRRSHSAVWGDGFMVIWGGLSNTGLHPGAGGRYAPAATAPDGDGDGYTACTGDCNDADAAVHPGAAEVCDGVDNDCDQVVDEIVDIDGDGFTNCGGDCNDSNPAIHPGAVEICDGADNDCDDLVDEGFDADGDGYVGCGPDCDDSNAAVHPGAVETCNGVDDDCSGVADEGFPNQDSDAYAGCVDCNDLDPSVNPGAAELCNQVDEDCDDAIDEDFDLDGDGVTTCLGDCNDADPGAWEAPVEVFDLSVEEGPTTTIAWFDLAPFLGPASVNDLVSGLLGSGAGIAYSEADCLLYGGGSSFQDGRPVPPAGSGFWYLARVRNSCGVGTFGFSSSNVERIIPACP